MSPRRRGWCKPPRVAAAPCALECKMAADRRSSTTSTAQPLDRYVVFGQVVGVHIDDRFIKNGRLDTAAMKPIARCGYDEYAVVESVFSMTPPGDLKPAAALDRSDDRHGAAFRVNVSSHRRQRFHHIARDALVQRLAAVRSSRRRRDPTWCFEGLFARGATATAAAEAHRPRRPSRRSAPDHRACARRRRARAALPISA